MRKDGRENETHRRIKIEIEKGVSFSFGLSRVYSQLEYGVQNKKPLVSRVFLEDNSLPPTITQQRRERITEEYERIVESTFTPILLDKESTYTIVTRILCDSGSIQSVIINSVSLLLVSYKVPIKHMVFSTTVGVSVDKNETYITDLTETEEREVPYITLAMPHTEGEKTVSYGTLSRPVLERTFLDLLEVSTGIVREIGKTVLEEVKRKREGKGEGLIRE